VATFTEHMKPRGQFGKEGVVEAVVVAVMTAGAGNGGGLPPPPPPPPPLLGVGATTTGAGVCPNIAKSEKPDVSHDTVWSEVSVVVSQKKRPWKLLSTHNERFGGQGQERTS